MLLDLLAAMECRQCVRIESSSSRGKNISFRVLPLKIYVSTQSGRRYVMCWFFKAHRIIFCRLDNLERVLEAKPVRDYDKFCAMAKQMDGDAYTNPKYRVNFREILHAVREKRYLNASYRSNKGTIIVWTDLVPVSLEYSAKDDKFRLQAIAERKQVTLNLGRIISVEAGEAVEHVKSLKKGELAEQTLVLEIEDERSTMVRALMHFSDLAKETEKLDESHYLLTVQYDKSDETEMLFRVLSFGPTIKVREPEDFKELIRKSSENSCNAAQNFKCVCFFP